MPSLRSAQQNQPPPVPVPPTPAQQNVVLTNLLQQFANGIPGLPGGPVLPPPAPPVLNWVTKNGITGPEHKAFFETELGLTPLQIRESRKESIEFPMDFAEFGEDDIDSIVSNMKKLKPPVTLHGIATMKLKYTCNFMSYLHECKIPLKSKLLHWDTIKYFGLQYKSLQDKHDKLGSVTLSKPSEKMPMIKWIPNARTKLDSMIGSRGAPLGYICEKPDYTVGIPEFMQLYGTTLPFSEEYGSILAVLILRLDHDHQQFDEDSSTLYDKIYAAFSGTAQASSFKEFKRKKDGYGLCQSIITQFFDLKWC